MAVLFFLVSLLTATAAVALFPPILARWVLTDGRIDDHRLVLLFGASATGLAVISLASIWIARRLLSHSITLLSRTMKMRLTVLLMSTAMAVVIAEVGARATVPLESTLSGSELWIARWHARHPDGFDKDSASHVEVAHRHDPDLGWIPTPGYRSDELNVNSRGLRGVREHPVEKPQGERNIVLIGDSFTFGDDVADPEVYAERLEAQLDRTRVINLGVAGYGTDQQHLRLLRSGFDYHPDLIVQAVYRDDVNRNMLSFRSYAKPVFHLRGGRLQLDNVPIPPPQEAFARWPSRTPTSYVWALIRKASGGFVSRTRFAPKWKLAIALLGETMDTTRAHGAAFLLVYIPTGKSAVTGIRDDTEIVLSRWTRERGVPFVNLRAVFQRFDKKQRAGFYLTGGHWSPRGHQVAADAIGEAIARDKLLRSPPNPE